MAQPVKKVNGSVFRTLFNQARGDLNFVTLILSILIANKVGINIKWWYIVLGGLFLILHIIWNHKRGYRQIADYGRQQSKEFQELKRMVKEIHDRDK